MMRDVLSFVRAAMVAAVVTLTKLTIRHLLEWIDYWLFCSDSFLEHISVFELDNLSSQTADLVLQGHEHTILLLFFSVDEVF